MSQSTMTRRGFFWFLRPKHGQPARPPATPATVEGVVPAGQVFSLERFYAERKERDEDRAEVPCVTPELPR